MPVVGELFIMWNVMGRRTTYRRKWPTDACTGGRSQASLAQSCPKICQIVQISKLQWLKWPQTAVWMAADCSISHLNFNTVFWRTPEPPARGSAPAFSSDHGTSDEPCPVRPQFSFYQACPKSELGQSTGNPCDDVTHLFLLVHHHHITSGVLTAAMYQCS